MRNLVRIISYFLLDDDHMVKVLCWLICRFESVAGANENVTGVLWGFIYIELNLMPWGEGRIERVRRVV